MNDDKKKPIPLFVIDPAPTIEWPVTVSIPVDGGELADQRFTGIFKRLSESALDKLLGVAAVPEVDLPGKRPQAVLRENAELLPELVIGWRGVKTTTGDDAEFSAESLQAQILGANGLFLSAGLWRAIAEIRNGARLGN